MAIRNRVTSCLWLLLLCGFHSEAMCCKVVSSGERKASATQKIIGGYNTKESAYWRLVLIASANRVPTGIVLTSGLCSSTIPNLRGSVTLGGLAAAVEQSVPEYAVLIKDGVLLALPRNMASGTRKLLSLQLKKFRTHPSDTHKGAGFSLGAYVMAGLAPQQGWGYENMENPDAIILPELYLKNVSVLSALDYIATRALGGIWIMTQVDNAWMVHPGSLPFHIEGYGIRTTPAIFSARSYFEQYCKDAGLAASK